MGETPSAYCKPCSYRHATRPTIAVSLSPSSDPQHVIQAFGNDMPPTLPAISLPSGSMPALGLGTWMMGEHHRDRKKEVAAIALGLDLGMTLIDTAEMYADGGAEEGVGGAMGGGGGGDWRAAGAGIRVQQGLPASCKPARSRCGMPAHPEAPGHGPPRPLPSSLARRYPARGNRRRFRIPAAR